MTSVTYSSTRGGQVGVDFRTVVMQGLAADGGLFVPDEFPAVSAAELSAWRGLSYADLAVQIISKFVLPDQIPADKLRDIVHRSCDAFRHPDVTPVVKVGDHYVLELFHGPTFAFKDVALQMLGNFFEYFLETGSNGGRLAVLGATSGDTGSAAIAGLRGKKGVDCIILFPKGRVSAVQQLQMTTVTDDNIHCCAIRDGTFDDCQDLVKASFNTPAFRNEVHLGAVNSINWCRVLAQTTYYFWSYLRVREQQEQLAAAKAATNATTSTTTTTSNGGSTGGGRPCAAAGQSDDLKVNFSVPTGNFGDILAGFYARQMKLPVGELVVATNENDILHRFFTRGEYHREPIRGSISPSMDICVSSNFERYLYHLAGKDATKLASWMRGFEETGKLTVEGETLELARQDFKSGRADTAMTLKTIKEYAEKYDYVLCPHSAVGVNVVANGKISGLNLSTTVCLATAHHGKFPDAVSRAVPDQEKRRPPEQLDALRSMPTRLTELPKDVDGVQDFVRSCVFDKNKKNKNKAISMTVEQLVVVAGIAAAAVAIGIQMVTTRKR